MKSKTLPAVRASVVTVEATYRRRAAATFYGSKVVEVILSLGMTAKIDAEDMHRVSGRRWRITKIGTKIYAQDQYGILMHTHLMGHERKSAIDGTVVHHVNGDGLDNRKSNLIIMSSKEHAQLHLVGLKRRHDK